MAGGYTLDEQLNDDPRIGPFRAAMRPLIASALDAGATAEHLAAAMQFDLADAMAARGRNPLSLYVQQARFRAGVQDAFRALTGGEGAPEERIARAVTILDRLVVPVSAVEAVHVARRNGRTRPADASDEIDAPKAGAT